MLIICCPYIYSYIYTMQCNASMYVPPKPVQLNPHTGSYSSRTDQFPPPPDQSSKTNHDQINSHPHSTQHTQRSHSPPVPNTPQSPVAAAPETKYHSPPPLSNSESPLTPRTRASNPPSEPHDSARVHPAAAQAH